MDYSSLRILYPPRIETVLPPRSVKLFDNGLYFAEPKLNGSSVMFYSNGKINQTFNRRKERFTTKIQEEINDIYRFDDRRKWMVVCGEYMNKNKKDETGNYWNHKYVIWDILVYNGVHLVGKTTEERKALLAKIFPGTPAKKNLIQISENCFRTDVKEDSFEEFYNDLVQYDMYEGLVLKQKTIPLEMGSSPTNTKLGHYKVRKKTKNYNY